MPVIGSGSLKLFSLSVNKLGPVLIARGARLNDSSQSKHEGGHQRAQAVEQKDDIGHQLVSTEHLTTLSAPSRRKPARPTRQQTHGQGMGAGPLMVSRGWCGLLPQPSRPLGAGPHQSFLRRANAPTFSLHVLHTMLIQERNMS